MSWRKTLNVSLAFVGLLVGAGFATGQEVIQYFVSFGVWGLAGTIASGIVMILAGAVILQLGSYFLATDHKHVFRNVSHPVVSVFLDVSVTVTMFAIGFVMLAGAGSTMQQQFGVPTWIGAGVMVAIVMVTGLLDVDRVASIISNLTYLIIAAVVVASVYAVTTLPVDVGQLHAAASQAPSPVSPWWLSALNYTGLALILGVSMCLVIGGNTPDPRVAVWGGVLGGTLYTVLLTLAGVALFLTFDSVGNANVPMLKLFETMHPLLGVGMAFVVFAMIYNTSIGMFYALGRRLTANHPSRYRTVFLITCLLGYAVSFFGFGTLMTYVYPVIGYVGMVMIVVMLAWWVRRRVVIAQETGRRDRMRVLLTLKENPNKRYSPRHDQQLHRIAGESRAPERALTEAIDTEVLDSLSRDGSKPREK